MRSYRLPVARPSGNHGSISACAELPHGGRGHGVQCRVYLRVCGVTQIAINPPPAFTGLSPRVRSYHLLWRFHDLSCGSISACAELPSALRLPPWRIRVYLRVCGVTSSSNANTSADAGLSPRVRSYPPVISSSLPIPGSISACAELPGPIRYGERASWVYLRVCGVTPATICRKRTGRNANDRP